MRPLLAELRWTDAVDILVVAALVYGVLAWLRRSRGALVAVGLGLVGAVYLGAGLLDLRLTTQLFQGLLAVSLVVLVVVFQEELRQAFEELAALVLRRRGRDGVRPRLDTRDILVSSLFELARDKVGALVVVPGEQHLERHVRGGFELDGRLSRPLLKSLFDPHSEGHDGAAIVVNRRVTRFGVRLPLSRGELRGRGTRHGAALGLTERSDALCLVVSEERGSVAAALGGRLREVSSPHELGALLDRFFRERHPLEQRRRSPLRRLGQNAPWKGLALLTASGLWLLLVPGSRPAERSFPVPVRVSGLPGGLELRGIEPPMVRATFLGAWRDLVLLGDDELAIELDASPAALGRRTFDLSAGNVRHPDGLELRGLEPARIQLSVGEVQSGS